MIRQIIHIDEERCNGCGLCAGACQEGAIGIVDGKAKLLRDDYCDGLGNCLPVCPTNAISFIQREAAAFDEAAVEANMKANAESELRQWPVQIKLVPVNAPYFDGAHLLIAADCNRITLIGCPKLDEGDYSEKLTEIIHQNDIKSVTIVRMQVPCCGGLARAAETALKNSGKFIPWQTKIISTDGHILNDM